MTQHEGKLHWEHAQKLIGDHGDVPCFDAMVRCDHERAAVHAALAQAHALAAIAVSLEQIVRIFTVYESVPATSPAGTDEPQYNPFCTACGQHGSVHDEEAPFGIPGVCDAYDDAGTPDGYLEEPELTP